MLSARPVLFVLWTAAVWSHESCKSGSSKDQWGGALELVCCQGSGSMLDMPAA